MPTLAVALACVPLACSPASAPYSAVEVASARAATSTVTVGRPERPRDPWVFRSVLDGEPRMVVLALHEDLWVAYDAGNGELARAWTGDVVFRGAVHDAVHGPQPESRGTPHLGRVPVPAEPAAPDSPAGSVTGLPAEGPEPAFRALEPERAPGRPTPFRLLVEGRPVEARQRWLGYVLRDDGVVLRSALEVDGRRMAVIEESPDVLEVRAGRIPFERSIVLRDTAPQVDVELRLPATGADGERLDWRVRGGALRSAADEPGVRIVRLARAGGTVLRLDLPVE